MFYEKNFESASSGSSYTYAIQPNALHIESYVALNYHPCKVVERHFLNMGKVRHAKVNIIGVDIFTGKKYEDTFRSTHSIQAPFVTRKEYQLIDIANDGFLTLLNKDAATKEDVKLEDSDGEIKKKLNELLADEKDIIVGVMQAMGRLLITEKALTYNRLLFDYNEFLLAITPFLYQK